MQVIPELEVEWLNDQSVIFIHIKLTLIPGDSHGLGAGSAPRTLWP